MIARLLGVLSSQFGARLIALAAGVLAARLVGPAERGWFGVAIVIPMFIMSATDLGLRAVLLYHLPRARGDADRVGVILSMALRYAAVTLVLMALVYATLGVWAGLRDWLALPLELVALSGAYCALNYAFGIATVVFEGLGDFGPRNLLQLVPPLGVVAACGVATLRGERWGAAELVLVYAAGLAFATVISLVVIRSRTAFTLTTRLHEDWRSQFLAFGLTSAPGMVATHLNARVDTLFVARLAGAEQTGLYAVATSVAEWPVLAVQSLTTVLLPGIGAARETDRERLALVGLGGAIAFSALSAVGLALAMGWLLPWLYGAPFAGSTTPAVVLLQSVPALAVTQVAGSTAVALGRPGIRTLAAILGLGVTVALDLLWIPSLGATGAAWASVCSYVMSAAAALIGLAPLFGRSPARLLADALAATMAAVRTRGRAAASAR